MDRKETLVIGSSSQLARAYMLRHTEMDFIQVGRGEIESWLGSDDVSAAFGAYLNRGERTPTRIMIFAAITDNSAGKEDMRRVNLDLPLGVLDAVASEGLGAHTKVWTFGSALERRYAMSSPYLKLKLLLSEEVVRRFNSGQLTAHIRMHTVYGAGFPKQHMFLGQALAALSSGEVFSMSSGLQVRQYVHVDDLVSALDLILEDESKGIYEVTSPETNTLGDIAVSIFRHFGAIDRLRLGVLSTNSHEPIDPIYKMDPLYSSVEFRPTLLGINEYFESLLSQVHGDHNAAEL
jgi:nucleoside-diphosphate-sugar epimerase